MQELRTPGEDKNINSIHSNAQFLITGKKKS